jgi:hypothetical protein
MSDAIVDAIERLRDAAIREGVGHEVAGEIAHLVLLSRRAPSIAGTTHERIPVPGHPDHPGYLRANSNR